MGQDMLSLVLPVIIAVIIITAVHSADVETHIAVTLVGCLVTLMYCGERAEKIELQLSTDFS